MLEKEKGEQQQTLNVSETCKKTTLCSSKCEVQSGVFSVKFCVDAKKIVEYSRK